MRTLFLVCEVFIETIFFKKIQRFKGLLHEGVEILLVLPAGHLPDPLAQPPDVLQQHLYHILRWFILIPLVILHYKR